MLRATRRISSGQLAEGRDFTTTTSDSFIFQHEVLLLVGEEALNHLYRRHVRIFHLAHQKHAAGLVRHKVQFFGTDIHIPGQDIV